MSKRENGDIYCEKCHLRIAPRDPSHLNYGKVDYHASCWVKFRNDTARRTAGRLFALLLAVMTFTLSDLRADDYPSFSCRGVSGHDFRCAAASIKDNEAKWTLYSEPAYFASGPSASFPAPREWSVIEMKVQDLVIRALVRYSSDKKCPVFAQYDPDSPTGISISR